MISPTGKGMRTTDRHGAGHHGAPRGNRLHNGLDFKCSVGQDVVCPIDFGKVVRISKPYRDDLTWSGLVIENDTIKIQMWYLKPLPGIIGNEVRQGQLIGHAQDISEKYEGMTPHIHLRIMSIDPALFLGLP